MATITGSAGNDILLGSPGDDVIETGGGADRIDAGAGDDVVRITGTVPYGNSTAGQIDGGVGHDILDLSGWQGHLIDYDIGGGFYTLFQWPTGDNSPTQIGYFTGFEEVHLGPGVQYFSAYQEAGANVDPATLQGWTIVGSEGRDQIVSGRGYDKIDAGAGDDYVDFWGGGDRVSLGDGNDLFEVAQISGFHDHAEVDGGSGSDTFSVSSTGLTQDIRFDLAAGTGQIGDTSFALTGIENLESHTSYPPLSARIIHLSGGDEANSLTVDGVGNPVLSGRGGDDVIQASGLQGALTAFGGAGSDTIFGSNGADWINGGGAATGDTLPSATADGGDQIWGGDGNDHIFGNSQFAVQGTSDGNDLIQAGSGMDYANGNGGNDSIYGGEGPDRLYGGAGDDWIDGDEGSDHINGNKGNDRIEGDAGNDEILGGQGDDWISGGQGLDTVSGNAGNDVFFLGDSGGFATTGPLANLTDVITDFQDGQDKLNLNSVVSTILHPGSAADFAGALGVARTALLTATSHDVAAVQVGDDTYLFYDNFNHAPEAAVRLINFSASAIDSFDFTL